MTKNVSSGLNEMEIPTVLPQSVLFIYGPPASGKSTTARALAESLNLPYWDLDSEIENYSGMTIPEVFALEGEEGFRHLEKRILDLLLGKVRGVVALGGGALLDPENHAKVTSSGIVICLSAPSEKLAERLESQDVARPLLKEGDDGKGDLQAKIEHLLNRRAAHYASFPFQLNTANKSPRTAAWEVQIRLGIFHVKGMGEGYDVRIRPGGIDSLGEAVLSRDLKGPFVLVSDETVGDLYGARVHKSLQSCGFECHLVLIPPGEAYKSMDSVSHLWQAFINAGLERNSTVVALGGGVIGDLTGFTAATFHRGIPWVVLPTTLLAMTDASLGGKTAVDLPQGKNLVGAFHPPRLVLADPHTLASLPQAELRSGLAEVIKVGIIGDADLFEQCSRGWESVSQDWNEIVRRAIAVKIQVIEQDPFEQGLRAALNFGHTIGHALEAASAYTLRHGEAVSIGMVIETRISEQIGLAEPGLADKLVDVLTALGLPASWPEQINREDVLRAIGVDKKRSSGMVRFSLPLRIGEVQVGCEIDDLDKLVLA
jgi:shikimate kinase / 3-dehydroquinate synthase